MPYCSTWNMGDDLLNTFGRVQPGCDRAGHSQGHHLSLSHLAFWHPLSSKRHLSKNPRFLFCPFPLSLILEDTQDHCLSPFICSPFKKWGIDLLKILYSSSPIPPKRCPSKNSELNFSKPLPRRSLGLTKNTKVYKCISSCHYDPSSLHRGRTQRAT